jgi:undecaprenyl diphosphate synthase
MATTATNQDALTSTASQERPAMQIAPENLPQHVAIIMDGNGRWAQAQNKDRSYGHIRGAQMVRPIVEESARLGIKVLTLYSFSTENWSRSSDEVQCLMDLYVQYLIAQRDELAANNVRLLHIGRREGLPQQLLDQLDRTCAATSGNTGMTLAVALNYGSRLEITDAVRQIASEVKAGRLDPQQITERTISNHLNTAGLPDPDLLIRTAGEMRLSNYLLWQISYAEFYVAEVCWPQFDVAQYHLALQAYARRKRKFGAVL